MTAISIDDTVNTDWLQKLREEAPAHTCVDQPNLPCPACTRAHLLYNENSRYTASRHPEKIRNATIDLIEAEHLHSSRKYR